ncbi:MAG: O-antigen ligase family protein [Terriglobales bacterium]
MSPDLALLLCAIGVAGLFYLDRGDAKGVTRALWLPTLWIAIVASKPVSYWLGVGPTNPTPQQIMDGSPLDAAVLGALLLAALIVAWRRREQVKPILKLAWPILLYFGYCGLSTFWSAYTEVSFKRWIKSWGDLAMVLVIATEPDISAALRRLFSRVGFLLLPVSIVLIKYFPAIGRGYDPSGGQTFNGVTGAKNSLGVIAYVVLLGVVWHLQALRHDKAFPNRGRHLLAQLALLGFGIWALVRCDSDTSMAALALGSLFLLLTALPAIRKPAAIHALVLLVLLGGSTALLMGGEADVTHDMGRKANLSDRTTIWKAVEEVAAEHPIFGVGFESFWAGANLYQVWRFLPRYEKVNESHDGYIEVYAEIGWVGVALIALLLITAYRRAVAAFRRNPALGGLLVAYVVSSVIYNITEAGFRMLDPAWIFLLFAFVASAHIAATQPEVATVMPGLRPAAPRAELVAGERWRGAV